jgi:hypothetical protein
VSRFDGDRHGLVGVHFGLGPDAIENIETEIAP